MFCDHMNNTLYHEPHSYAIIIREYNINSIDEKYYVITHLLIIFNHCLCIPKKI